MTTNIDLTDTKSCNPRFLDVAEEPKRMLLPIEGYEKMSLVTLEEAIEPIVSILSNIKEKVYVAKYNCEQSKGQLTPDQAAAIMLYTMESTPTDQSLYYVLNSILRSDQLNRRNKLKPWFSYLKLFITALSHIHSYRGTVYRGVNIDLSEYYPKGKKFVWWGFSSCTTSLDVLQSELYLGKEGVGTLFIIECFSGKDIREYSFYHREDEVLLVAARQFVVVGRVNLAPHLWTIHVKEIEPPFPFLITDNSISSTFETSLINNTNNSSSTNVCPTCSKIFSKLLTSNAETTTVDLDKFEFVKSDSTSSSSLPLINSVVSGSQQIPESVANSLNTYFSCTPSTTDLETVATIKPIVNDTQEKIIRFKDTLISEESAKIIAENICKNSALEILYFVNNDLKDDGLHHIIQAIADRSLLKVFIVKNKITDVSATLIAELLSNVPHLMAQVHLDDNLITSQGVKSIIQALKQTSNSSLKTLSFNRNSLIDDQCIDDIINLLKEKQTLRSLYLENCHLSEDGKKRLKDTSSEKKNLLLQI